MLNGSAKTGFEERRGWLWPIEDTQAEGNCFFMIGDLELAYFHVKKFDVVVQAGGNMGVWPKKMAEKFKRVYTFEPEARNFYCLVRNCPEPNIYKYQCALGYEKKMGALGYEEVDNLGSCYVTEGSEFPIVRLDDFALDACDFLQLDVEGYDYLALRGAEETIKKYSPVIMVEDKGLSERYDIEPGLAIKLLLSWGYELKGTAHRDFILCREQG